MKKQESFAYHMYRKKTIKRIEKKVILLGENTKIDAISFLNLRFVLSILIFLFFLFYLKYGSILSPIITLLFSILWEKIFLDINIHKRCRKLEDEAIFFFEILCLTLESHKHIKGALELTVANINSELSQEFKKTLMEVRLGKSFTESLATMKERIPSDSINNIILSLTESSIFGNNITETLNNQLEFLKEKKLLGIKAEMNKLPTKISVLSVVFFVPIMLLIILAPILLEFLLD